MSVRPDGPEEVNSLEKLLTDVQKVIRDNELFLKNLANDELEAECGDGSPDSEASGEDGEGFEEL